MTSKKTLTQADANFLKKELRDIFPTKYDLNVSLDKLETKFEEIVTKFKDKFYTKIDPILKEVVVSREDRLMGSEQHLRNKGRIEKLEKIHSQSKHLTAI